MRDAALLSRLEEVLKLESTSLIRYLIEGAEAKVAGEFDQKALALYREWYAETERSTRSIRELLSEEDYFPQSTLWPLSYSQFNYLNAAYLLRTVIRLMSAQLEAIRGRIEALQGWPQARELVAAIVEREEIYLQRARALEAERPREAPRPPRVKGTSAARW
jgi:hypothetical protein